MKTIDLAQVQPSLSEILAAAKDEAILIRSASGEDFLLEPADEFDREVASLAASEKFTAFLQARSNETNDKPLSEVRERLRGGSK